MYFVMLQQPFRS